MATSTVESKQQGTKSQYDKPELKEETKLQPKIKCENCKKWIDDKEEYVKCEFCNIKVCSGIYCYDEILSFSPDYNCCRDCAEILNINTIDISLDEDDNNVDYD